MAMVAFFIPDLQSFNLADDIVVGNVITWAHTWKVIGYGAWMTAIITALAYAIFYYKEI
jgi:dihydroorotate dehydrogenase